MKIEIKIDEACTETKIIVVTSKVTEELGEIVKRLSSEQPQMIAGFQDGQAAMLVPNQIDRVYASEGKVYAETETGTYLLRLRLYEAEQRLTNCSFNDYLYNTDTEPLLDSGVITQEEFEAKKKQILGV